MKTIFDEECLASPEYSVMSPWAEHVPFLFWIVSRLKPRVYVELGVHLGMSYFAACQAVSKMDVAGRCYGVETWEGDFCADDVFARLNDHNQKTYADFSTLLRMRAGQALDQIEDGSVDLLHVDGRPSYDEVKQDFEAWIPKLSGRAVVMFHNTEGRDFGVWQLWDELAPRYPSFHFLHGQGLGVLAYGSEVDPALAEFFAAAKSDLDQTRVRRLFSACGRQISANQKQKEELKTRASLEAKVQALNQALRAATSNRQAIMDDIATLQNDLATARSKPRKILADYVKFHALSRLSRFHPPFSKRMAAKFALSAAKRDPKRSLAVPKTEEAIERAPDSKTDAQTSRPVEASKDTIMIVSHDASRTEAPILALNLAKTLSVKYNIINVILGDGALYPDFCATSVATYEIEWGTAPEAAIDRLIDRACRDHSISYALVNSVESRGVLASLAAHGIPSLALVHAFATSTQPVNAVSEVFSAASQVVFSSDLTLENALMHCGIERSGRMHILPPGNCGMPVRQDKETDGERRRLERVLRPGGAQDQDFLVLGAGPPAWRNGVDLFIECATRVITAKGGGRFRFVWITDGSEPVENTRDAADLADQISRAGIQSQFSLISAPGEIDHACASADMLLLSARLDPLPNAAIGALVAGTPVVCFNRSTGIAGFLIDEGLGDACVAQYLDTADMAQKLRVLAGNDAARADIVRRGQEGARQRFDFPRYAEQLDAIASGMVSAAQHIEEDISFIRASGKFRPDFFRPGTTPPQEIEALIRQYLDANRTGQDMRKPMPGFHPGIYAAHHGTGRDPFVQFLRDGEPEGPWSCPVIDETQDVNTARITTRIAAGPVALHLHAYYPDQIPRILERLEINVTRPDLFVSAPEAKLAAVQEALAGYSGRLVDVQAVPNRGRDIGPLLTAFGKTLVENYDVVGHVHTKASTHIADARLVRNWADFLEENLLGGRMGGAMLDRILTRMEADPQVGIVYPDNPHVINWTDNRGAAQSLAQRLGIPRLPGQINFPAGTMFWMRTSLLTRFVDLNLGWDDYPPEPLAKDGSRLHAIERLFGVVAGLDGLKTLVTNVHGVTR